MFNLQLDFPSEVELQIELSPFFLTYDKAMYGFVRRFFTIETAS